LEQLVFKVKDEIWKVQWNGIPLQVIPIENDYNIIHGSKVLHKGVNIIDLLDILEALTGKTPLFTTKNNEGILNH